MGRGHYTSMARTQLQTNFSLTVPHHTRIKLVLPGRESLPFCRAILYPRRTLSGWQDKWAAAYVQKMQPLQRSHFVGSSFFSKSSLFVGRFCWTFFDTLMQIYIYCAMAQYKDYQYKVLSVSLDVLILLPPSVGFMSLNITLTLVFS